MGRYLDREWVSRFADGGRPRSETREGTYQAYLPDLLVGRDFTFSADAAADLADAERAIARLDAEARALVDTEGLARLLLRAEAVASSHIEGLTISAQRLLRYDLARREGDEITDDTASQVLANVDALSFAFADAGAKITVPRILEVHRRLLRTTRLAEHAGVIRTVQNWIGGNAYTPCGAAFVPPPPEYVADLLTDLCAFANGDGLPATAQAAIAHAQFETIHPFVDGNGRTGRALMYMILRKRGLALRVTPPISLILATEAQGYVRALQATRFTDDPLAGNKAINAWIGVFASACTRAVRDAESFESRVAAIIADWEPRLAAMRSDASAHRLLALLPRTPIVSTRSVEEALGVTYAAANAAIAALVAHEILTPARAGRRNRVFEARDILDAFTELERRTASRTADTQVSPLERDVPARPQRR